MEAQMQGSKVEAEEGTLVILAAGDKSLFDECQSCFIAMSKNSFYLGRRSVRCVFLSVCFIFSSRDTIKESKFLRLRVNIWLIVTGVLVTIL